VHDRIPQEGFYFTMAAARFSQFGRRMMYNDPIRNEGLKGWPNRTEYKNVSLPADCITCAFEKSNGIPIHEG
jgi:hypothetical protein